MKKTILSLFCCLVFAVAANAQYKFPAADVSPADILYYPLRAASTGDAPKVRVIYSRPQKKGRDIFGTTEPFGKVWRAGANESTEIHFFTPVTIGGKKIPAGVYSLFAIPEKDKWTFIINSNINRWGAFSYDQSKDIVRVPVNINASPDVIEYLSMTFTDAPNGANLVIGWDKTTAELPIAFN